MARITVIALALGTVLAGCSSGKSSSGAGAGTDADIAQYETLAAQLDGARTVFDEKGGQDLVTAENLVFWLDASGADNPILHSYDTTTKASTVYDFTVFQPLGDGTNTDKANFSPSTRVVASMNRPDKASVYTVGSPKNLVAEVPVPAPPFGAKWWPYSVSGADLYVALQKIDDAKYTLQKFASGSTTAQDILVFDDLVAPNKIDEFIAFAVDGDTVIFDDHGRVWSAPLQGGTKAKWVLNSQEIGGLSHDATGVIYNEGLELWRYTYATDTRENLSDKIRKNGYRLNTTFAGSHHPSQGGLTWCQNGTKIIYVGNSGLYSYDFVSDVVKPVLLQPRDGMNTTTYIHPVATADGSIFVTGLLSTTGSVGASGPIYRVPGG